MRQRPGLFEMDFLIFVHDAWRPVREITFSNGTLFITTYRGETASQGEAPLIWADKLAKATAESATSLLEPEDERSPAEASEQKSPSRRQPSSGVPASSAPVPTGAATSSFSQRLQQVTRYRDDKLYVKTAVGLLVVEGHDLRWRLQPTASPSISGEVS